MNDKPVILFDGICNLCNSAVRFVINHDKSGIFQFASLQSEAGRRLLIAFGLPQTDLNSFVLIQDGRAFTKSTAALMVAKKLDGAIRLLGGFIFVPVFIRDGVYSLVAANRYRWFGKKETCMLPTPALESRFLK